jgi:dolichol-phosphate mannosyltransferase
MRVFCLIPAYNEKGNLLPLVKKLDIVFNKLHIPCWIFFVIQGEDGSHNEIKQLQKRYKNLSYVYYPQPLGIGKAYRIGFDHVNAKATHVLTLDADLNHDPDNFPQFIKQMNDTHADVVIGSRYMSGGQFLDTRIWKRIISLGMNQFITFILKIPVHDISSGFRLIRKEVITKIKPILRERNYPSYMEFIIQSNRNHYKLSETSIVYTPRTWGVSKMNTIKTLKDYIRFLPRVFSFIS